jgi:hypothetical protein
VLVATQTELLELLIQEAAAAVASVMVQIRLAALAVQVL